LFLIFLQTGALALMTLTLTGVVRGGTLATPVDHSRFIQDVLYTRRGPAQP
jgi:polyisoprenyl-phosphate glycosyltransferase